jgi:glycosyltransferase involved in cell wall biosynthesis
VFVKDPLFTIYVVSKNYASFLSQAIMSVINQTVSNWELFLIDNDSSDNSYEIMLQYNKSSEITCIRTENLTIAQIANYIIPKARGKFIMRLDADDFLDFRALEIFNIEFRKNPKLMMIYPDYFLVNEDGRIVSLEHRGLTSSSDNYKSIPPNGACTVWRLDTLKKIGGYDESLSAQDGLDVWFKALSLEPKLEFMNLSLPLFYYRQHRDNLTSKSHRIITARQSIKRRYRELKSDRIVGVVPCRSNFDFLPNTWALEASKGMSLLEKTIFELSKSSHVTDILIAGDTDDIQAATKDLSLRFSSKEIHFFRRDEPTDLTSPNLLNMLDAVYRRKEFENTGIFLIKFPQAPLIDSKLIDELIDTMQFESSDSSCVVSKVQGAVLKRGIFGVDLLSIPSNVNHFYDSYFRHTNSLFALNATNLHLNSLWGRSTSYIECDELMDLIADSKVKLSIIQALLAL